ncbi:ABC transporter substrate-binding protein [Bradyrhizobium sp. INPA01-394B]|uniref:Substrate-binding domain-containing protein n=1 Tax=Bradyrhizobium campsiandrae TaxID=1729892 RepID=A0ABR7U6K8_9BRAD|nr:substrate-binding domain-containing protein [Bradyrhizobium campsiandrae]MBC9882081.1 ABC transporter substrate-binding protein [Bradyrhizobium campsiandrae]MBC9979658.1 substrate-binding domain-containing protein [Bradyrhizobium campsiandrae]
MKLIAAGCAGLLLAVSSGNAAELKTFATIAVESTFEDMVPKLEAATGDKLVISWATAAMLSKRVQDGEAVDVLILTKPALEGLAKDGKAQVQPDSVFASTGIAVAVKGGAAKPDISTPDAFKRALLEARSVAFSDPATGAASGVYIAKLMERLGIADEIKRKTKYPPAGGFAATLLVNGEADLAIQLEPEIVSVQGVEKVGSLPAELNNVTVLAAGLGKDTKNEEAGLRVIKYLHSPEAVAAFRAHGVAPAAN